MPVVAVVLLLNTAFAQMAPEGATETPAAPATLRPTKATSPSTDLPPRDSEESSSDEPPEDAFENIADSPAVTGLRPFQDGGGLLYSMMFDQTGDVDGNLWPDGWSRRKGIHHGIGFPPYVEVGVRDNENDFATRSLHVALQGGGVALYSPPIPVRTGMCYSASIYVSAAGLQHNDVFMSLTLLGDKGRVPLKTVATPKVRNTGGWRELRIDRLQADLPEATHLVIGLNMIPSGRQDLEGDVDFVNLRLDESPTVILSTVNKDHLFFEPGEIDVHCRISGIPESLRMLTFLLEDTYGREVARRTVDLKAEGFGGGRYRLNQGFATWRSVPVVTPGFYRVRVETYRPPDILSSLRPLSQRMESPPDQTAREVTVQPPDPLPEQPNQTVVPSITTPGHEAEASPVLRDAIADARPLTLAYIVPSVSPIGGEFGWTLEGFSPRQLIALKPLIAQAAISRLKLSTWLPENAADKEWEDLREFCLWSVRRQIRLVGLLAPPPEELLAHIQYGDRDAASLFSMEPEKWSPALQKMMARLSLLVRDWQLTGDADLSITELSDLRTAVAAVRMELDKIGFDTGVGFAWNWNIPIPISFRDDLKEKLQIDDIEHPEQILPPVETGRASPFEQLSPRPRKHEDTREFLALDAPDPRTPLTPDELAYQLRQSEGTEVHRWPNLIPLTRSDYTTEDRVLDLVQRMLVAKINRADALFFSKPFDDEIGLMNDDGTPGELFLPWRTTAQLLNNRRYAGSIRMPRKSTNIIFEGPGRSGLMVLWNERASVRKPINEIIYLGRDAMLIDLDGNRTEPVRSGFRQIIPVGPVPVFISGLDMDITRWRQQFVIANHDIPSFPNRRNNNAWTFVNDSEVPLSGTLSLEADNPGGWTFAPAVKPMILEPGASKTEPFTVTLTQDAIAGTHQLRAHVKTEGPGGVEFTIFNELTVGGGDLSMEFMCRLNRRGELEVHQTFINDTDRSVSYACDLFPEGRLLQTYRITNQPPGQNYHVFLLPNGQELDGKMIRVVAKPFGRSSGQPLMYRFRIVLKK